MSATELQTLLDQYMTEKISKADYQRLWATLQQPEYAEQWYALTEGVWNNEQLHPIIDPKKGEVLKHLRELSVDSKLTPSIHRVHFLRRGFLRYAAAVILIAAVATVTIMLSSDHRSTKSGTDLSQKITQSNIHPGGEHAILTLGDGRMITLDSVNDGQLASQGGVKIVKLSKGKITYDLRGLGYKEKEIMWNTMSTPTGGQYQVILPDGTKVWLNASSSITFPTVFTTAKREVKITGEIYFEVAKNKEKPFVVDVNSKSLVEVLGTSFNINSYEDEENIKTTLLEGSVKVNNVLLKPGEQAQVSTVAATSSSDRQLKIINGVNIAQTLAWKNAVFDFNGANVRAVMRQLERWYGIEVHYQGEVPNIVFEGEMYMNTNFSDVLKNLQKMGIKFRLEGKKLIVL